MKSFLSRCILSSFFATYFVLAISPSVTTERVGAETLTIPQSKAECVMEINSRRVLYEEHGDVRLPMASTTKILTCATVLENCEDLDEEFSIPPQAVGIEGSSVYLKGGEMYSVRDLLYGLMLRSGNDCAVALALRCSGSLAEFSAEMNKTAQKAGAVHSRFENPHGLPSANHYTTARDLSLISSYAMQNPTFREIVATKYYEKRQWKNKNKLLFRYEHVIGVKTGYTKQAGRCLVTAAQKGGMTLVCSVLNSPNMYERSVQLLDDAFSAYEYTKLLSQNETVVVGNTNTMGIVKQDYYYPLLKEEKALLEIRTKPVENGLKNEEIVGEFEIYLSNRLLFSGNLYKL